MPEAETPYQRRLRSITLERLLLEHEAMAYALEALPGIVSSATVKAEGRPRPSLGADVQQEARVVMQRKLRELTS